MHKAAQLIVSVLLSIGSAPALAQSGFINCETGWVCSGYWVAAQDVGVTQSFFDRDGKKIKASDIASGDQLVANRDIHVRLRPDLWKGVQFVLRKGQIVIAERAERLTVKGQPAQVWIKIQAPVESSISVNPSYGRSIRDVLPAGSTLANVDDGIWWEYPIGQATAGYDAASNRTLIRSYNLVVLGPTTTDLQIEAILRRCVERGGVAAYHAFTGAPSPEVGARVALAWSAFQTTFRACIDIETVAQELKEKFQPSYTSRARWEPGLNLTFTGSNPSADNFRRMHDLVRDQLPQPINQVMTFYAGAQDIPSFNAKIDPPAWASGVLATLPDTEKAQAYFDDAQKLADSKQRDALIADLRKGRIEDAKDQVTRSANEQVMVAIRLSGAALDSARSSVANFEQALVPAVDAGKVAWRKVQDLLPPVPVGPNEKDNSRCAILPMGCPPVDIPSFTSVPSLFKPRLEKVLKPHPIPPGDTKPKRLTRPTKDALIKQPQM